MDVINTKGGAFKREVTHELRKFVAQQRQQYPEEELLKIDLHCHDHNSDKPDELIGRILNVPETWLATNKLVNVLKHNGTEALTITNHNNATSCWTLKEEGVDVLVGAEFTVTIPEYGFFIHVLTYGFSKDQENKLNELRRDLYKFLAYCKTNNIPTIWAHPLYNYYTKNTPDFDFFFKLSLLFERFEILNGQRETWQNLLVKHWIERLTPNTIDVLAEKYGINPHLYCHDPYSKSFSGGSDSHMGIFAGTTGSYLHVPNLNLRRKDTPLSVLALEAIKAGKIIPYGEYVKHEKLTISFLDYFCQVAMYHNEPGLMRILLHNGTPNEKLLSFAITNVVTELRQHKVTMNFVKMFHDSMQGKAPNFAKKLFVSKAYKPVFKELVKMASVSKQPANTKAQAYHQIVLRMADKLSELFYARLEKKINETGAAKLSSKNINSVLDNIELSSDIRNYLGNGKDKKKKSKQLNILDFLDGLSFPLLSSSIILAANYTSAKVLFNHRDLLNRFADRLGVLQHPKRLLWLTDTFDDNNGVSMVLQQFHTVIKERNLPIDILVCSDTIEPDDHLYVVKPRIEFAHPVYENQPIRIPDYMEVHNLFDHHEYDRILCSTEGPMGMAALYLKNAFSVKASFYVHTDWVMFGKKVLKLNAKNLGLVRRLLRSYYKCFDHLFVLNTDHYNWLTSSSMGFKQENVSITAHWIDDKKFAPRLANAQDVFGVQPDEKVLLFVGRISEEKGVMQLPQIYKKIKKKVPNVRIAIIGSGPMEKELRKEIPDGIFKSWLHHDELPNVYSAADLLVFPSKFDTFSCVVLESMSCGLPVIAYETKGPKDIIDNEKNGLLVSNKSDMVKSAVSYLQNKRMQGKLKLNAIKKSNAYNKAQILSQFLYDVGLEEFDTSRTQLNATA